MFKKIDPIISFFFPKRCLSCRVLLPYSHPDFFCTDCRAQIIFLKEPWCEKCGDPFLNEEISSHLCQDCLSEAPAFEKARSLLQLNDVLIPLIYRLKYQAMRHLIKWSRPFLKEFFDHHFSDSSVDLVMPIPLHTTRLLKRGYNQSLLIAKSLAADLKIQLDYTSLIRNASETTQVGLSREARRKKIKGVFRIKKSTSLKGKNILLIDDVYTTGATLQEAASVLVQSGAIVNALTLARTPLIGYEKKYERIS